jgi:hypothetical protein
MGSVFGCAGDGEVLLVKAPYLSRAVEYPKGTRGLFVLANGTEVPTDKSPGNFAASPNWLYLARDNVAIDPDYAYRVRLEIYKDEQTGHRRRGSVLHWTDEHGKNRHHFLKTPPHRLELALVSWRLGRLLNERVLVSAVRAQGQAHRPSRPSSVARRGRHGALMR